MRALTYALLFFLSIRSAFAWDASESQRLAALIKPERLELITCLSDLADRAKAQGMSNEEFKDILEKACRREFDALNRSLLERMPATPTINDAERERAMTLSNRGVLSVIYNEFSNTRPYRYRLKDAESRTGPTAEDVAFKTAREEYSACLSKTVADAKSAAISTDDFKKSLDTACPEQAETVRRTELSMWDTYANPPPNRAAAGRAAIRVARDMALKQYSGGSK